MNDDGEEYEPVDHWNHEGHQVNYFLVVTHFFCFGEKMLGMFYVEDGADTYTWLDLVFRSKRK